jgi:hypothetical protein
MWSIKEREKVGCVKNLVSNFLIREFLGDFGEFLWIFWGKFWGVWGHFLRKILGGNSGEDFEGLFGEDF